MSKTYKNSPDPDRIKPRRTVSSLASVVLAVALASQAAAGVKPAVPAPVVNVNTATQAQLAYLPGVGPKTAVAIAAGRPYAVPADIDRVKGIGPVKLARMLPYVAVSGPTTAAAKIQAPRAAKPAPSKPGGTRCPSGARCG